MRTSLELPREIQNTSFIVITFSVFTSLDIKSTLINKYYYSIVLKVKPFFVKSIYQHSNTGDQKEHNK